MYTLNCKGTLLSLEKPVVMGILNLTPDSFYAPSRQATIDLLLTGAEKMIREGATILDIGAQSTRPGSEWLNAEEEWERLSLMLPLLCRSFPKTIFSIDSFHASVVQKAADAGVGMVNDISGGLIDSSMLETVAKAGLPYICMHMKGSPQTMASLACYENLMTELIDYFVKRIQHCREAGIKDIIIDPGFGFAKNTEHNFEVLQKLDALSILGYPLLLGISRKSMVTKTLGITAAEALNGTTVLHTVGLLKGVKILRVHDVKEACEAIALTEALQQSAKSE